MTATDRAPQTSRLETLMGFIEADPANPALLAEAATAAADEAQWPAAAALIARHAAVAPLPAALANLEGVIALRLGRAADAERIFQALLAVSPGDPALIANLAWARLWLGQHEAAAALVDDAIIAAQPSTAALKVQALHHLGRLDDALAVGQAWGGPLAGDRALMSALALVAIDAEAADLARAYAERAGPTHEGLGTLGMLALNDGEVGPAGAYFDKALGVYPDSARALLGKGLTRMAQGDAAGAAPLLERAAALFGRHLGSWVAAGWALFAAGDAKASRAMFDKALALDAAFAETHGALAVLDVLEGDTESARRRLAVAQRLDRACFSAALAQSLLMAGEGKTELSERVRAAALNTPIGADGRTLGQAMVVLGGRR